MRISPESMLSSPAIARSVVVLPQPDGPSSTTNSPCLMCRFSLRITWFGPKCLSASMIWMSAMSVGVLSAAGAGGGAMRENTLKATSPTMIVRML